MVSGRGMGFLFAPVSDDRDCNELEGRRGLDGYGPRSVCGDRKALVLQELNWGAKGQFKVGCQREGWRRTLDWQQSRTR